MFSTFFLGKNDPALLQYCPFSPFTIGYIIIMLFAFILIFTLAARASHKTYKQRVFRIYIGFFIMVLLNVARFAWEISTGTFSWQQSLPLQLCGLQMFVLPVALFARGKIALYARDFSFAYGIIGFVLALLMPFTTLFDYPLMHFRSLQSLLYHGVLGYVCLLLPHTFFSPVIKGARSAYIVLGIFILITSGVNMTIGSNYLYTARLPLPIQPIP